MIDASPPPSPSPNDGTDRSAVEPKPPKGADGSGVSGDHRGTGSWLRSRRRGHVSSYLPLRVDEAFLVRDAVRGPVGGLVRFRVSDADEAGPSRRSWWKRTDLGRQLAGSAGELRLVPSTLGGSGTHQPLIALLTLNGVTDTAPLVRLDLAGRLGVDVHFYAGLWGLALPAHTRCRMHLEGPVRLLPAWPAAR
ncbi:MULTISPECIES: hypothetical protein [unclassified Streptomyces]|uniref:hypothetical protein n=1 Tax=unclassified Streptomyces TaxID=2593676 RepID=UPI003802886A